MRHVVCQRQSEWLQVCLAEGSIWMLHACCDPMATAVVSNITGVCGVNCEAAMENLWALL